MTLFVIGSFCKPTLSLCPKSCPAPCSLYKRQETLIALSLTTLLPTVACTRDRTRFDTYVNGQELCPSSATCDQRPPLRPGLRCYLCLQILHHTPAHVLTIYGLPLSTRLLYHRCLVTLHKPARHRVLLTCHFS